MEHIMSDKTNTTKTDAPAQTDPKSDTPDVKPDFGPYAAYVTEYAKADRKGKARIRGILDKAAETAADRAQAALEDNDLEAAMSAGNDRKQAKAAYAASVDVTDLDRIPVDWAQRVSNRVVTLRAAANRLATAKPGMFGIPEDAEWPDELPKGDIDDKRLNDYLTGSLGPKGTKAASHSAVDHVVETVTKAGKWLSVAEMAKIPSDAYEGGSAGTGAIGAVISRNDPKLRKNGLRVHKRTNGAGTLVSGVEPIPASPSNKGGRG